MRHFYWDSSALFLRYFRDPKFPTRTDIVNEIFNKREKHRFATSFWAVLEFNVACDINRRRGASPQTIGQAKFNFHRDVNPASFLILRVNNERVRLAAPFPEKHGLSSSDSLHLATAIVLRNFAPKDGVVFISADDRLCITAEQEGFEVINPNEETKARQKIALFLP